MRLARDLSGQNRLLNIVEAHKSSRILDENKEQILDTTLPEIERQLAGWLFELQGMEDHQTRIKMSSAFIQTVLPLKQHRRNKRLGLFLRHRRQGRSVRNLKH